MGFEASEYTVKSDSLGILWVLNALPILDLTAKTRIYQASTSEPYGLVQLIPQKAIAPLYLRSPYGVVKL
jgi:GDPmannose 4,6-dehydratase